MTDFYTGANSFDDVPFQPVPTGTTALSSLVRSAIQALVNRDTNLQANVNVALNEINDLTTTVTVYTTAQRNLMLSAMRPATAADWSYSGVWTQENATSTVLQGEFDLTGCAVQNTYIDSITINLTGSALDSNLPVVMPVAYLYSVVPGGTVTLLGQVTDSSNNITAYKLAHSMTISYAAGTAPLIDRNTQYMLQFVGENSTNANSQLKLTSVRMTLRSTL